MKPTRLAPESVREGSDDKEEHSCSCSKPAPKRKKNSKMRKVATKDGECGCGGTKGNCTCDGECGGSKRKMDSLTSREFLKACEMGIEHKSVAYIKARLDKKCGESGIPDNAKCTKSTTATATAPAPTSGKPKSGQNKNTFGGAINAILGTAGLTASAVNAGQHFANYANSGGDESHLLAAGGEVAAGLLYGAQVSEGMKGKNSAGLYGLGGYLTSSGTNIAASIYQQNKYANKKKEASYAGDPFKDLGVSENASPAELRKAYMQMAKKHHPDAGGTNEDMAKVTAAYNEALRRKGYKTRGDSIWADGFYDI